MYKKLCWRTEIDSEFIQRIRATSGYCIFRIAKGERERERGEGRGEGEEREMLKLHETYNGRSNLTRVIILYC